MRSLAAVILVAIGFVACPGEVAQGASVPCREESKRLSVFKKRMAPAKRKYFRTHHSIKARKAFVRRQQAKLRKLKRARARCLAKVTPPAVATPAPPGGAGPPTPAPTPAPDDTPATDAIGDLISPAALVAPSEVSLDGGTQVVRTQLELDLAPGAKQRDLEALLDRLDAQIVSSLDGVGLPTVRIPDPGSLAAVKALVASLQDEPVLDGADLVSLPVPETLPDNIGLNVSDLAFARPQLAAHTSAAWNARAALTSPPTLLQADYFGDGAPGLAAGVTVLNPSDFSAPAANYSVDDPLHSHGYLVLGMAAGAFDAIGLTSTQADMAVGTWAGPNLPLSVIDLRSTIAGSTLEDRILQRVRFTAGNVVVNTSLGAGCASNPGGCDATELAHDALKWTERVRNTLQEHRFLQISAAGNMRFQQAPTSTLAARNSVFNAAALAPLPGGVPNLSNVVVVESAIATPPSTTEPFRALCRSASSKQGGDISAIGTDVRSLGSASTGVALGDGGTSSATPQVAGIAASMWAARPGLSPAEIVDRLRRTARPVSAPGGDARCHAAATPAPVLDAYAALLSTDRPAAAPALRAVLDVADVHGDANPDGRFDERDITAFVAALDAGNGVLDYGMYDLNGDGRTGGAGTDQLDLDRSDPVALGSTRQTIAGLPLSFDETALTDLDVLCHAAHGTLYVGDPTVLARFGEERCLPPIALDVSFPSSAEAGQNLALQVTAERTDTFETQSDVAIELTVTGGSVTPSSGVTGAQGTFDAQAQLANGAAQIEVVVEAKLGNRVLDSETVVANADTVVRVIERSANANASIGACAGTDNCNSNDDSRSAPAGSGSLSFSAGPASGASASRDGVGSASGTASGSIDATMSQPGGGLDADFTCTQTAQVSRTVTGGHPDAVGASGGGGCTMAIEFQVRRASAYEISGTTGAQGNGGVFLVRRVFAGGSDEQLYRMNAGDTGDPGATSGTLQPGQYFIAATAYTDVHATGFGPDTDSQDASTTLTLTVTP